MHVIQMETSLAISWFDTNSMRANPDKFQAIFPGNNIDPVKHSINVNNTFIKAMDHVKILGITIDSQLKFDKHISDICKQAGRQLNVMHRLKRNLCLDSRKAIYQSFLMSVFNYCPVVWHFCSMKSVHQMEHIHERALRFVFNNQTSTYEQLLEIANVNSLYMTRVYFAAIEVFKAVNEISPPYMCTMFQKKVIPYNMRDPLILNQPKFSTRRFGYNSFAYFGAKIWNSLPVDVKSTENISKFKAALKCWCQNNVFEF